MCGIAGIVHFDGEPLQAGQLRAMSDLLAHRGPDGDGMYCEGPVGLAHRRLAIIDPLAGQQPYYSDDRKIVLSYNGEVYNYKELRAELQADGPFRTTSDTEVVLRAYQKWGIECLSRFRGMFAFALFDSSRDRLYLVRDRVGIKPLFYARWQGKLAFASELTALTALEWLPRDIDPRALAEYFRYLYIPAPATIYRHVRKLLPGHYLEIDIRTGKSSDRQYWRLQVSQAERQEKDWLEELQATLREVTRLYVRSDVPFGAFLSGGVDSSLVTALMTRELHEPVQTFSIGFGEAKHSELPYAATASASLGTRHHEKVVTPRDCTDLMRQIARHFGEPFGDSSAVPTYYVSQEAAKHVKMVLSGDGGDELFGGYDSYVRMHGLMAERPALGGRLASLIWRAFGRSALQCEHDKFRTQFDDGELGRLLPDVSLPVRLRASGGRRASIDPITRFQAEDFELYLPGDVLTKVDRMSMANSLEVRVPLLDHVLVDLAFSLPLAYKLRGDNTVETKYLLKRVAAPFFEPGFLDRPKRGFGIPILEWCTGPLASLLRDRLCDRQNALFDLLSYDEVQAILRPLLTAQTGDPSKAWSLLMLDLWLQEVHGRQAART